MVKFQKNYTRKFHVQNVKLDYADDMERLYTYYSHGLENVHPIMYITVTHDQQQQKKVLAYG